MSDEKTVEEYEAELKDIYARKIELEKAKLAKLEEEDKQGKADELAKVEADRKESEKTELINTMAETFGLEPKDKVNDGDSADDASGTKDSGESNTVKGEYDALVKDFKEHYKSKKTGRKIEDVEYGSRAWLGENISA